MKKTPLEERFVCSECKSSPPPFISLYSLTPYTQEAAEIIHRLKYGRKSSIARCLGAQMAIHLADRAPFLLSNRSALVPVPLTFKKLFKRGFNQSALIAKSLGGLSGIPSFPGGLRRTTEFHPQTGRGRLERKRAMKEVFLINSLNMEGRENIILLDDVATTLSTLNACTGEIQRRFGKGVKVYGITAARSL